MAIFSLGNTLYKAAIADGAIALIKTPRVGDRKTVNGKIYVLNKNRRWERVQDADEPPTVAGVEVIQPSPKTSRAGDKARAIASELRSASAQEKEALGRIAGASAGLAGLQDSLIDEISDAAHEDLGEVRDPVPRGDRTIELSEPELKPRRAGLRNQLRDTIDTLKDEGARSNQAAARMIGAAARIAQNNDRLIDEAVETFDPESTPVEVVKPIGGAKRRIQEKLDKLKQNQQRASDLSDHIAAAAAMGVSNLAAARGEEIEPIDIGGEAKTDAVIPRRQGGLRARIQGRLQDLKDLENLQNQNDAQMLAIAQGANQLADKEIGDLPKPMLEDDLSDLGTLFNEVDRVGGKYQTDQERADYKREMDAELKGIDDLIDGQTPDLENLFIDADRVGSKYQTDQEKQGFQAQINAEAEEIGRLADEQLPDDDIEVVDYSGKMPSKGVPQRRSPKTAPTVRIPGVAGKILKRRKND